MAATRGRDTSQVIDTCRPATDEMTQYGQTHLITDWLKLSHCTDAADIACFEETGCDRAAVTKLCTAATSLGRSNSFHEVASSSAPRGGTEETNIGSLYLRLECRIPRRLKAKYRKIKLATII